jgi:hypothetical protein
MLVALAGVNLANSEGALSNDNTAAVPQPFDVSPDKQSSGMADFARNLAYSAIQNPITGISQIADKAIGSNLAKTSQLLEKSDNASFGSIDWHAQQVATAVGSLVPFMACLAVTKNISRAVQAEEMALSFGLGSASATASVFRAGEMAVAGFGQAAILEPNQHQDRMFQERLTQGVVSGVTMGSMHALSNKLSEFTGAAERNASIFNKIGTTALAGAGGGFVGIGAHDVITGERTSGSDGLKSIYQAAFSGAILGGLAGSPLRLHQPKSDLTHLEEYLAKGNQKNILDGEFFDRYKDKSASLQAITRPDTAKDFSTLSPLERVEVVGLLARDADPLLARPEVMNEFINKIKSIPADAIEAAEAEYRNASDRAYRLDKALDAYNGTGGEESNQNKRDFAGLKRLHKKAESELFEEKEGARFFALEQRRVAVETAVNEFLTDHGLPTVELRRTYNSGPIASYQEGQVRVDEFMLLSKKTEPNLINSVYHELTHLRQDMLHIKLLADKLEIPAHPTEAEVERVKSEFKRIRDKSNEVNELEKDSGNTGLHVFQMYAPESIDYRKSRVDRLVDQVLTLRSENGLSATEKPLAEEMSRGIATYSEQNYVENLRTTERQLGTVKSVVQHPNSGAVDRIFQSLLDSTRDFQQAYGFKTIPSDLVTLAQEHKLSPFYEFSPTYDSGNPAAQQRYYDRLINKIEPSFQKQLNSLSARMLDLTEIKHTRYMRSTLEAQAFPTGYLAEIAYNAQR